MICTNCGGNSPVELSDFINLRPLYIGTKKIYTVCLECGEVVSIKVKEPEVLKK